MAYKITLITESWSKISDDTMRYSALNNACAHNLARAGE